MSKANKLVGRGITSHKWPPFDTQNLELLKLHTKVEWEDEIESTKDEFPHGDLQVRYKIYLESKLDCINTLLKNAGAPSSKRYLVLYKFKEYIISEINLLTNKEPELIKSILPLLTDAEKKYIAEDQRVKFGEIEKNIIKHEYLSNTGQWKKDKIILCALVHKLYLEKIFINSLKTNKERKLLLLYKKFISKRYNTNLNKEFQPSRFDQTKINDYNSDFVLLIPE